MLRRTLLRSAALIVPTLTGPSVVTAQATPDPVIRPPVNPFADLGLPVVTITVTASAIEGLPSVLPAGRYIVSVTDTAATDHDGVATGVVFAEVPTGMTTASVLETITASASMPAMMNAESPSWMADTTITGGPYARNDEVAYAVIDLTAGSWILWTEDPNAVQAPVPITVTGEAMTSPPIPVSDVRIGMDEFFYTFSNVIGAGPLIIEVANIGTQPHFLGLIRVPKDTTVDEVQALVAEEIGDSATPVGKLTVTDVEQVFAAGDQSAGVTAWYAANLSSGTYAAVCFLTDSMIDGSLSMLGEQGASHTMMGMVAIIEVT